MSAGRSETFLPQNQLRATLQLISLSTFGLCILFICPRAGTAWGKAGRFGAGQVPSRQFLDSWSNIPGPPWSRQGSSQSFIPSPIPQISLKSLSQLRPVLDLSPFQHDINKKLSVSSALQQEKSPRGAQGGSWAWGSCRAQAALASRQNP